MKIQQLSVLATVVIAFAALAALVLTGQAGIRQDLQALRIEMLAGQAEVRNDIRAGQAELRKDMRAGQAELRKDIRTVEAGLRQEMKTGQAELRAGQTEIRKDLQSLDVRLAVVEQRTAGLSGEPGASTAEPAPAAVPDARHRSARASLLLARAVTATFAALAAGGTIH